MENSLVENSRLSVIRFSYNLSCRGARRRKDDDEHGADPPYQRTAVAAERAVSNRQGTGDRPEDGSQVHGKGGLFTASAGCRDTLLQADPYKATIEAWLVEDEQNRYKQRHTTKRVYVRLIQTYSEFNCSYPAVNRYVSLFRQQRKMSKNGYLELQWHPGEVKPVKPSPSIIGSSAANARTPSIG